MRIEEVSKSMASLRCFLDPIATMCLCIKVVQKTAARHKDISKQFCLAEARQSQEDAHLQGLIHFLVV